MGNVTTVAKQGITRQNVLFKTSAGVRPASRTASTSPRPQQRRRDSASSEPGYKTQGTQKVYANVMTMEQMRNSQSEEWDEDNEGYFAVTHGIHPLNPNLYDDGEYQLIQCNMLRVDAPLSSPSLSLMSLASSSDMPPPRKRRRRSYSAGEVSFSTPVMGNTLTRPTSPKAGLPCIQDDHLLTNPGRLEGYFSRTAKLG